VVESAAAEIAADEQLYEDWLRALQDKIDDLPKADQPEAGGTALKSLVEQLPDLYRSMKTERLEERISNAMFAADVNGRLERAAMIFSPGDRMSFAADADPDYLRGPETFDAAQRWFGQKVTLPTDMTTREIALEAPADIRKQAFFSARVASANILESLRGEIDQLISGKIGYGEARKRLTEFLAREGYGIPTPGTKEDRAITDIASTSRLELVLRQNTAMAHAIGQRVVSEHPYAVERYPNYRYIANTDRHAKFHNLVLPKSDPFWKTYYPPWDFNCKCIVVDEDAPANERAAGFRQEADGGQSGRLEIRGQALNVYPPASGFVFKSDPADAFGQPDASAIENEELRRVFEEMLAERRLKKN